MRYTYKKNLEVIVTVLLLLFFSRMTIAYFSISGLDILGALEDLGHEKRTELIDWIYSLQVVNN